MTTHKTKICSHACWLVLLAVFFIPTAATSYVVYFNDGSNMATEGPYIVQGDRVLVTLPGGTETTFSLSEIDQEKTRIRNQGQLSDVVVIDSNGTRAFTPGQSGQRAPRTLQDAIREGKGKGRTRDLTEEATNAGANRNVPRTLAGFPDLARSMREPLTDTTMEADLSASLRAMGVAKFRLYQGTQAQHLMIEVTTTGKAEVFRQLEALTKSLDLATENRPFTALEVLMLDNRRSRAGQFLLSRENAPLVTKGILTPEQFFLQYVQF